jgi:TRAP-type mannitol/chloroaromatic compound transport system substrate-binding protein
MTASRYVLGALAVSVAVMGSVAPSDASAQDRVRWKMQSTFGSNLSVLGESGVRFSEMIEKVSGGEIRIEFFEPNALVPSLEGFGAVQAGSIDALWGTAGYHVGKIPALAFFTAVPFGPDPDEIMAWLYYGGGDEIYDRVYAENGLKGIHCGIISPEASGWFREEINSPADLQGLKMRFFGLGAQVMQKLGVSPQLLAAAEIYPALERGVIDATEFSMPSMDRDLGFYQIAKNYYFPGWHQQASVLELLMNKGQWDGLSDQQRVMIEVTCGDNVRHSIADSEAKQAQALTDLQEKGVVFHRWSDEMMAAYQKAWDEVVAEQSAADPLFKEVWESYSGFREKYLVWKDYGYLK